MKNEQTRACLYISDIQRITGKSYRTARKLNATIKKQLNKERHQFISVEDFCAYTGLSQQEVIPFIRG